MGYTCAFEVSVLLFLLACTTGPTDTKDNAGETAASFDQDGDGYGGDADCDDESYAIHPGAEEVCDGLDNNCDGSVDEAGATGESTWYADEDGDTYGDPRAATPACEQPVGSTADLTDCDDTRPDVSPAGVEVCDDADTDEDCDGLVDDEDDAAGGDTWYLDADQDGAGASTASVEACDQPVGYVATAGDCADDDPGQSPTATEVCDDADLDEDCDGLADDEDTSVDPAGQATWYADADGDGAAGADVTLTQCEPPSGYGTAATDCDDANPAVSPSAPEVCDGLDDDCDGLVDDDDPGIADSTRALSYADDDGDGHGDPAVSAERCPGGTEWVPVGDDCDDTSAAVHPGATEDCSTVADDDCDGAVDAVGALGCITSYTDADGDGSGGGETCTCVPPSTAPTTNDDCDDTDGSVHPGAAERCDGLDQDCDGEIDEGLVAYVPDWDSDGFGDALATASCTTVGVSDASDCDDAQAATNPLATETCNGVDDDCDGLMDGDDPSAVPSTWYADADGDGYGDSAVTVLTCEPGAGYVAEGTDCDDATAAVYPGATEVYGNDTDDDCDGEVRPEACSSLYDQDQLPVFELDFTDADWAALEEDCYSGEQEYHPVTFTWEGESVSAYVRLKGNWTWNCGKFQFVVSFNEDDSSGRFHGQRKIVLDAPWYDRTLLHERLAFPLFERLGLPYSCVNNAEVYVNGAYYGLYANTERLDREYLERNFEDPDGNLYEAASELETNEAEGDTSDLAALNAATTVEELAEVIDLEEATAEWAAEAMIPALDNYWAGVEINYYIYHYPGGKFLYLPYDMDLTFGDSAYGDGTPIWADVDVADPITWEHTGWLKEQLFETVLSDPTWCGVYVEKVTEARAAYDPDEMTAQVYEWDAQIYDAFQRDTHLVSITDHDASIALLVQFLQDRADAVDEWLAVGGHCPATW